MRIIFLLVFFATVSLQGQHLSNFDWLIGEWHFETDKKVFIEKWDKVSPKTIEGSSYTISKESQDTTFSESLRLLEMTGEIFYLPYVNHNPLPIAFKLIKIKADSIFFENKDHDFPTRIIYIRKNANYFVARVEGNRNGKQGHFELLFEKKTKK